MSRPRLSRADGRAGSALGGHPRVFERLAASYEALAQELERLEQADGPTTFDALSQTVDRLTHTQAPGSEEPRP